ncbi:MAG: hypothetical protein ACOX9B_13400 [Candidatus Xenobium sp.]|jgi:hypothetical protein|nr:hypothetical protein [Burkholderiales bacterium]
MSEAGRLQEIEALLEELRAGRLTPVSFREALAESASEFEVMEAVLDQVGFPEELEDSLNPVLSRGRQGLVRLREGMARLADPGGEALQSGLELVRQGVGVLAEVVGSLRVAREELERRMMESGRA